MRNSGFISFSLALLAACASSTSSDHPAMAVSQAVRETAPVVPATDATLLRDGNAAFAFDMQRTLGRSDANLAFSPYSISLALAMTYAGARGTTATEMASALHFTLPTAQLHPAFDAVDLAITGRGPVALANSLWASPTLAFEPPFLDTLATNYGAGVRLTDFGQAEEARSTINGWVSDQTHARIEDLIPEGMLDSSTRLVLVNAIYFKAAWQSRFHTYATQPGTFHGARGDQSTPLMHLEPTSLPYAAGAGYAAVALPYEGGAFSMIAVLADDLTAFESSLDAAKWGNIVSSLQKQSVVLTMPKVKIESEGTSLAATLQTLGMKSAFGDTADFSGMSAEALQISDVVHKAFVAIDEEGSEAAAATAVALADAGALAEPPSSVNVTLDRPFLFAIRDDATGAILFLGHVVSP